MNIFVLDLDPVKAAQYQCDKHVVKMILETAQLLCSVYPDGEAPYKRTHYNHPCAIWTRESYINYQWLIEHGYALCDEYKFRYNKEHKSRSVIDWCNKDTGIVPHHIPTQFPECMPDQYKTGNIVYSYRNYYMIEKRDIAKWSKRSQPDWWK